MAVVRQYSDQTDREIQRVLERERQLPGFQIGEVQESIPEGEKEIRWAITTTNADHSTYPTAPANRFVVRFGEIAFDDTDVGLESVAFEAYEPEIDRIALSWIGFIPEDFVVQIYKNRGLWYIRPPRLRFKAVTTETISANGSGTVNVWLNGAETDPVWAVTAHLNWMHGGSSIGSDVEVIIEWFQDEDDGAGLWVITNSACSP